MIESPPDLQRQNSPNASPNDTLFPAPPPTHLQACTSQHIPTAGNAAGNTLDLFDLRGAPESVPPLPDGFTPRGIVALVFSCLVGLGGVGVIAWYGRGEIEGQGQGLAKGLVAREVGPVVGEKRNETVVEGDGEVGTKSDAVEETVVGGE